METIDSCIRGADYFLRRCDLLQAGYTDSDIRAALGARRIFRVRHGWYSVPDAPAAAIRAVRVGGRLTSVSALESYDLPVPRRKQLHIAVPAGASRLRAADDRRRRLGRQVGVRVHWSDHRECGESVWRVSVEDALVEVLIYEPRDVAVACASAVMHRLSWSERRMDAVFDLAPEQARAWRPLVSALDEAHGETFFRLWALDAGLAFEQQVTVRGIGRFDFKVGPHTYLEIDGGQHDAGWTDTASNSWEKGHDWDTEMAILGNRVLRVTYRQLYRTFGRVLESVKRAVDDDEVLTAQRKRHPYRPVAALFRTRSVSSSSSVAHAQRKRRRFATKA